MDNFKELRSKISDKLVALFIVTNTFFVFLSWIFFQYDVISEFGSIVILSVLVIMVSIFMGIWFTRYSMKPFEYVRQAIVHVAPGNTNVAAPQLDNVKLGRELVTSLVMLVYQYASKDQRDNETNEHRKAIVQAANIVSHIPLPLFVFNKEQIVTNASDFGLAYSRVESSKLFGKPLYDTINMEFPSNHTLENWIIDCQKNKVTDTEYWERVRLSLPDEDAIRQCDIAAYYNRDNPSGTEFIVTLFDRTEQYNHDDRSMSFVALAVHELRTPLTILRGYIEVLQEELVGKVDEEMLGYVNKMEASASQLTAFVNNILNVSRIESNEMSMDLIEEDWPSILRAACENAEMRAKAHGIEIEYRIPESLPKAGIDKISMFEVVNNLLENAIKYSPQSKKIVVSTKLDENGMIETSVQDFGLGIPSNVLPYLFDKFYRNHRTKGEVSGTGLGLFLCKSIVDAHGGQIWAKSKENEGSTFAFTIQPYSQLAEELKNSNNKEITRTAHGWIKNHSIYRR